MLIRWTSACRTEPGPHEELLRTESDIAEGGFIATVVATRFYVCGKVVTEDEWMHAARTLFGLCCRWFGWRIVIEESR